MTQEEIDGALGHLKLAREALERHRSAGAHQEIESARRELHKAFRLVADAEDKANDVYSDPALRPARNRAGAKVVKVAQ